MQTTIVDFIIFQPNGFAVEITYKCTGVLQIAFFIAAVLAYPCRFSRKLLGIFAGSIFIYIVNLIRIVALFIIGVNAYSWFDFSHSIPGELLMILTTVFAWYFWVQRFKIQIGN
jgi:exosortase/archaeosortase family protein